MPSLGNPPTARERDWQRLQKASAELSTDERKQALRGGVDLEQFDQRRPNARRERFTGWIVGGGVVFALIGLWSLYASPNSALAKGFGFVVVAFLAACGLGLGGWLIWLRRRAPTGDRPSLGMAVYCLGFGAVMALIMVRGL